MYHRWHYFNITAHSTVTVVLELVFIFRSTLVVAFVVTCVAFILSFELSSMLIFITIEMHYNFRNQTLIAIVIRKLKASLLEMLDFVT